MAMAMVLGIKHMELYYPEHGLILFFLRNSFLLRNRVPNTMSWLEVGHVHYIFILTIDLQ